MTINRDDQGEDDGSQKSMVVPVHVVAAFAAFAVVEW